MESTILPLSGKQFAQLLDLSAKTQSYLCTDTVTFIELLCLSINSSNPMCLSINSSNHSYLKGAIERFKAKYYPNGYKENKVSLNRNQTLLVREYYKPRFKPFYHPYKEMEKTAFVRAVRACRDYLFSGMNEEDTNKFVQKISLLHNILIN